VRIILETKRYVIRVEDAQEIIASFDSKGKIT